MKRILYNTLLLANVAVLTACGGSSSSQNTPPSPPKPDSNLVGQAITIDAGNIIPSIGGDSTNTYIMVHNNAPYTISGIIYSSSADHAASVQSNKSVQSGKLHETVNSVKHALNAGVIGTPFIDPAGAKLCETIPAYGSCAIPITADSLSRKKVTNSVLVTADYTNGKSQSVATQIFNFQYTELNPSSPGLKCVGKTSLYPHGHSTGYGTAYCYVDGTPGEYFTVDKITLDSAVKILNAPPRGYQLAVGSLLVLNLEVGSVDIENTNNEQDSFIHNGAIASIDLTYTSSKGLSYTSTAAANIIPTGSGPLLVSGTIPLMNTTSNKSGVMMISNVGNQPATLAPNFGAGLTQTTYAINPCQATLESGASCYYGFNVSSASGSATISVSGGVNTVAQLVAWDFTGGPNVAPVAIPGSLSFKSMQSEDYTVIFYNTGEESMICSSSTPAITKSGSMQPTVLQNLQCIDANSNPTGLTLPPGGSCSYKARIADDVAESGYSMNSIFGTYSGGPTKVGTLIPWIAVSYVPNFTLTASTMTPTVNGDGVSTTPVNIKVTNNGSAPGVIEDMTIAGNGQFTLSNGDCAINKTLNPTESCTYIMTLGPVLNTTSVNQTGTESTSVKYSGGTLLVPSVVSIANPPLNWTVTSDTQNLVMTSYAASYTGGTPAGDGSSGNKYLMKGYMTGGTVTFTYENQGTVAITIKGINDNVGPFAWLRDNGSTCAVNTTLDPKPAANSKCTIIYDYVYNANSLMMNAAPSNYDASFATPNIVYVATASGSQFNAQIPASAPASGTTIYVNGALATWNNSVTVQQSGTTNESFVISSIISNAVGYNLTNVSESIIVSQSAAFTSYGNSGGDVACQFTTDPRGYIIEQCPYSPTTSNANAVYVVGTNQPYYTGFNFFTSFIPSTGGQGFSINTTNIMSTF